MTAKKRQPATSQPMTGAEFRPAPGALDLSVDEFSENSGAHRSTIYYWIPKNRVPKYAAWIIRLLLRQRQASEELSEPAE